MAFSNGNLSNGLNGHLKDLKSDHLYHFGLNTGTHNFVDLFGDVKFVCCGGSTGRMKKCAEIFYEKLPLPAHYKLEAPKNLCQSDRYVLYKVGPVLCVNHGMGMPSMSIMLHEMFKLLHYAGRRPSDVSFIRIGTSGGLGVEPGTVVVSDGAVNGILQECHEVNCCHFVFLSFLREFSCFFLLAFIVGKRVNHPIRFDTLFVDALFDVAQRLNEFAVVKGKTMSCDDFYEAQGRLDGAFCDFSQGDKMEFLHKAHALGVKNMEMEATAFAAMCLRAGFKCGVVCVTLVNRLLTDQISSPPALLKSWEQRPCDVVVRLIAESLVKH